MRFSKKKSLTKPLLLMQKSYLYYRWSLIFGLLWLHIMHAYVQGEIYGAIVIICWGDFWVAQNNSKNSFYSYIIVTIEWSWTALTNKLVVTLRKTWPPLYYYGTTLASAKYLWFLPKNSQMPIIQLRTMDNRLILANPSYQRRHTISVPLNNAGGRYLRLAISTGWW